MPQTTIREIRVEPVTPESIAPFGEILGVKDNVIAGEAHGPDLDKKDLVARTGMTLEVRL
jgi:hypothetical protein